ncbi:MAG: hypothetical protein GX975_06675, partial [Clostridiales bacterium]|nr:hypothetical protein [Clostridiales bacterium]
MRILTVISGVLLSVAGAFTFAFLNSSFTGLAFVLGMVMLLSGLCALAAYVLSLRKAPLPETVLVEGVVTLLFGFAVLNNEVIEAMIGMFFGTWLTIAGATRISQSLSVSRYRPQDWPKILPLAMAATIQGVIMMMPTLTSPVNPLFLVGMAFIANGLSQLIYSMYMKRPQLTEPEKQAISRLQAKKRANEEQRRKRNEMRNMSYQEREALREAQRREKKQIQDEKRAAKQREIQAKREARRPVSEMTLEFTAEETDQIRQAANLEAEEEHPQVREEAAAPAAEEAKPKVEEAKPEAKETPSKTQEAKPETKGATAPVWVKPENIQSLRAKRLAEQAEETAAKKQADIVPAKIKAINVEKIEEGIDEVKFEPVNLPEPELAASGGESEKRREIIDKLEKKIKNDDPFKPFEALKLEELFGDDYVPLREKD